MSVAAQAQFAFESTYVHELDGLSVPWQAARPPAPRLLALNVDLAEELGLDPELLRSPDGVALLVGNDLPESATPVAQAYAGHQFGGYSPQLGDGRALLLGELIDVHGRRRDLHLKGAGRTPFARGGDGKAAVGPMLREYVIGEAMHALGIPTTRALAVVATGEEVMRETVLPGALLARVGASHIRVGTFEYARRHRDPAVLRRLADYSIARHHPEAADAERPYLTFLDRVVDVQAALIASWMLVGFIHGVMNTDNMTISGETIDYGPCAFMDAFEPATVFSSIDHGGRYAYGSQPRAGHWNLARLAESLLPLVDGDEEAAVAAVTDVLGHFRERFRAYWAGGMRTKLGFGAEHGQADALAEEALALLRDQRVDYTSFFRALPSVLRGDPGAATALFTDRDPFEAWSERWRAALTEAGVEVAEAADAMDRVNPVYIPRNHIVENALAAATDGDVSEFDKLVEVVTRPYDERPGLEAYAEPAPDAFGGSFRTFCGT